MNVSDIKYLIEPQAVAIIGASYNPDTIGYRTLENIVLGGYSGRIYSINPEGGELLGYPVYRRIEDDITLASSVISYLLHFSLCTCP